MGRRTGLIVTTVVTFLWATACGLPGDASRDSSTIAAVEAVSNHEIPPGGMQARERLSRSPRHAEYVDIRHGTVAIRTWLVFPERSDKAPVVLVIQENRGLTDWIRSIADQLAKDGFIGVAPDLLSGKGPGGGNTDSITSTDEMAEIVRSLGADEVTARLDAVRTYATGLAAASGASAAVGFCWGGAHSFAYAARQPGLDAAVVFYGASPDETTLASVRTPVLGLYGGADARVNATIDSARRALEGKTFEVHIFEGAGHAFLRQQDGHEGANLKASREAWPITLAFLRRHAS